MTKMYRDSYDLFCVNGILFNHESPQRGETFVTRKISRAVARISVGIQNKLTLGNLDASRDWGFAGDYVRGMWMMLQHPTPDDWVLATVETYTVKEFLEEAFSVVNLDWDKYVESSEKYYRPNEVNYLLGDSSKAQNELGWKPETSFKDLVKMMVESDIEIAVKENVLINEGDNFSELMMIQQGCLDVNISYSVKKYGINDNQFRFFLLPTYSYVGDY